MQINRQAVCISQLHPCLHSAFIKGERAQISLHLFRVAGDDWSVVTERRSMAKSIITTGLGTILWSVVIKMIECRKFRSPKTRSQESNALSQL
jgi:hypothetical protein